MLSSGKCSCWCFRKKFWKQFPTTGQFIYTKRDSGNEKTPLWDQISIKSNFQSTQTHYNSGPSERPEGKSIARGAETSLVWIMWLEVWLFSVSLIWKSKQCQQKIRPCGRKIWWVFWGLFLEINCWLKQGNSSSWCFISVAHRAGRNQWLLGREFARAMTLKCYCLQTEIYFLKWNFAGLRIIQHQVYEREVAGDEELNFMSPNQPHLGEICAHTGACELFEM